MTMDKILLVDDDTTMLSLLSTFLEIEGFRIVPLSGGSDAEEILRRIRSENPELILMDVHLPRISGIDLVQRMRKDEVLKSTKVIMSSGMNLIVESRQAGADGFILKPYMPDELVKKIRETLNND